MNKTCGIYLYNIKTDSILIGHVTGSNGSYSIPKGRQDEVDNDDWDTAKRECLEETNIDLDQLDIKFKQSLKPVPYINKPRTLFSFLVIVDHDFDNLDVRCTSTFSKDGIEQLEIDKLIWLPILVAADLLPISQKENLPALQQIIRNIRHFEIRNITIEKGAN